MLKVLHLSTYDDQGGAAKAAYRIHKSQQTLGIDSTLMVLSKKLNDPSVVLPSSFDHFSKLKFVQNIKADQALISKYIKIKKVLISAGKVGCNLVNEINKSDYDIINLHWINNMLSISEIGRITKPIVWTLHDMWPFSGIFHYGHEKNDGLIEPKDYSDQIKKINELDATCLSQKIATWKDVPISVISPSRWLTESAKNSSVFKKSPISTIAHPVDSNIFFPYNMKSSRKELNLPIDEKLILFCPLSPVNNLIKGWSTILEIFQLLEINHPRIYTLVICGDKEKKYPLPFKSIWLEQIDDDQRLAKLYSAVNLVLCPSTQEALGQVAVEAQACGTPVIASDVGGFKDTIINNMSGMRIAVGDLHSFSKAIINIIDQVPNKLEGKVIPTTASQHIINHYGYEVIAEQYFNIYKKITLYK